MYTIGFESSRLKVGQVYEVCQTLQEELGQPKDREINLKAYM